MAHFPKPAEGSWTEHYPQLGTGPISFEDSISPEFYEAECKAVFERTWLNVGRVEQIPAQSGSFTKEIHAAHTSVIIDRDGDGQVRASKPGGEPVRCEVWEGFVFIDFDADATSVREYLGPFAKGLEGYPFDQMTQVFAYRAEIGSNWKLYLDAFAEFYHAPILHAKQYVSGESDKLGAIGYESLYYGIDGPHSMQSAWGGMSPPKDPGMVKPIERVLRSGNFGPWDRPDIEGLDPLPSGLNPSRHRAWGLDSYVFFPNFMMVVWAPGWYLTYHYWPTSYNTHIFEGTLYFVPPKTATDRLRQELAAVTFKEFGLQDCNTLEATQTMLESRAVTHFPLNDQEILIRHLHRSVGEYVSAYQEQGQVSSR